MNLVNSKQYNQYNNCSRKKNIDVRVDDIFSIIFDFDEKKTLLRILWSILKRCRILKDFQTLFSNSYSAHLTRYLTSRFFVSLFVSSFFILKYLTCFEFSFMKINDGNDWFENDDNDNLNCVTKITECIFQWCDTFRR